ncbi:Aste57867_10136 [Aphanomyces stellatus]|uniref:Aste57867_10136 protein n=1 Tax=Aphanomyces stellatus TaxID=120398 RepID=A0A485KPM6_9STRA|nr:hypothetical protein As57867_010097 [Aphanomyces stellatus]VFT87012.1 Aste57867_10136 [Aphanomyces stellatus]
MESTPRRAAAPADPEKPRVLWSSAKKSKRPASSNKGGMSADKENANAWNLHQSKLLEILPEDDVNDIETAFDGEINSSKIPRWERKKRRKTEVALTTVDDTTGPTSSTDAYTSAELLASIAPPREYQILRPCMRPPPPPVQDVGGGGTAAVSSYFRKVSSMSRVLFHATDEPPQDDFYLNVLASHPSQPVVACATVQHVVLYQPQKKLRSIHVPQLGASGYISAVAWTSATQLAIGASDGQIHLYDAARDTWTAQSIADVHRDRVGCLASSAAHGLSSGSRDAVLAHHDLRLRQPTVGTAARGYHSQEICGLAYKPNGGGAVLASGGNDNLVNLWDMRKGTAPPLFQLTDHLAAVKALAWCPWDASLLATGGGTADKCIKCWNTDSGRLLHSTTTHAQVSALVWASEYKELLSAHGFESPAMTLWSYPSMHRIKSFATRSGRILGVVANGPHVVSWSSDGALRQWDVFVPPTKAASTPLPPRLNDENAGVAAPRRAFRM